MHATDILAYAYNAELWCADHGAQFDDGTDEGAAPIFADSGSEFEAVEYCGHGHSFCMSCGGHMDSEDINNHFAQCWNCRTESVYVDGSGYEWLAHSWADALDTHRIEVYGTTVTYQTDGNGYTRVTAVVDESNGTTERLRTFVGFKDDEPSLGLLLILANNWDQAREAAEEYFREFLELADEEEESDFRAAIQCREIPTDQVWFSTKS